MESFTPNNDMENLIKELSQGRKLAVQLSNILNAQSSSSSSHENRQFLLHGILYSYDQALSMLGHSGSSGGEVAPIGGLPATSQDSPLSLTGSPRSDDSDQEVRDQASRKRKTVAKWTKKVKVCPETGGIEGQLDDGYNWRKYGQKDILGAKYPRGYYRCTHRHGLGCLATKQVQRSDLDPTIFDITYRRKHTCTSRANPTNNINNPSTLLPDPQNQGPIPVTQGPFQTLEGPSSQQPDPLFNIQTSLGVVTQDLGANDQKTPSSFQPFNNFPSSSNINPENNHDIFSDCDDILGDYSPNLLSSAMSRSNYFTISPNMIDDDGYGGLIPCLQTSEPELSPIIPAITSVADSNAVDARFPFGSSDQSESSFSFGNSGYYP